MANTLTPANPVFVKNTLNSFMELSAPIYIDGSATWAAGEFLRRASDGLMYECQTSNASGVGADSITHMAPIDHLTVTSGGVDTASQKFYIVKSTDVFEINEVSTAAATLSQVGKKYGMTVSGNIDYLNVSSGTTNVVFKLIDPTWDNRPFQDNSTDQYPRWHVSVLEAAISGTPAS